MWSAKNELRQHFRRGQHFLWWLKFNRWEGRCRSVRTELWCRYARWFDMIFRWYACWRLMSRSWDITRGFASSVPRRFWALLIVLVDDALAVFTHILSDLAPYTDMLGCSISKFSSGCCLIKEALTVNRGGGVKIQLVSIEVGMVLGSLATVSVQNPSEK